MARNMGFRTCPDQIRNRTKTVTRRLGWDHLQAGDILNACERCLGLRKGETVNKLARIRVVSVTKQPLKDITQEDVTKEGYPTWSTERYIQHFIQVFKPERGECTELTRIEFEYLDD